MKKPFLVFCAVLGVKAQDANEWIKYADNQMRGDRSESHITMTVQNPNYTRTLEIKSSVEGKNSALSEILSPAKEKGIRTLRLENKMWNYFPKMKRKIAVSSSMLLSSWMGSDFTNDDILKASKMSEDYSPKFLADKTINGESFKVIENNVKENTKAMWPKIVMMMSQKDCLPRYYEYYDKENTLKRTLELDKMKNFDGHQFLTEWKMIPAGEKNKFTTLKYNDVKFNVKFSNEQFSQKKLTE